MPGSVASALDGPRDQLFGLLGCPARAGRTRAHERKTDVRILLSGSGRADTIPITATAADAMSVVTGRRNAKSV